MNSQMLHDYYYNAHGAFLAGQEFVDQTGIRHWADRALRAEAENACLHGVLAEITEELHRLNALLAEKA